MDDKMVKLNGESFDVVGENISKLKEIFPEVVNGDNQIDFDNLRDILEKDIDVVDDGEEHYKFTWWGKKESKRKALESTTKTLRPSIKDSKNWKETKNIYIEGDNLDALKILLGSYRNRIKMIYIDPPYNTGHDFVYKDNRTETEKDYIENTEQVTEEGYLFENAKTEGKYHSNWLNMMYPRLYLAKKLLSEDGVIFISIDDNELENLKKITDEIFGEDNFVGNLIWRKKRGHGRGNSYYIYQTEYILTYAKSINKLPLFEKRLSEYKLKDYKFSDSMGKYKRETLEHHSPRGAYERKTLQYPIFIDGEEVYCTTGQWLWDKNHVEKELKNFINDEKTELKILDIVRDKENRIRLYKKIRLTNDEGVMRGETPLSIIDESNILTNSSAFEIKSLFDDNKVFDFAKPVKLIELLIELGTTHRNQLVLDFFSGSGTTAHSLLKLNSENNLARKFILVQIPEETDEKSEAYKAGFENICEIGKERIRRAGDKILEESDNKDLDIGFKVFKIDESNFIPWNPQIKTEEEVEQAILGTANNLVQGRSELDLVYELLLQLNLDLNAKIEEKQINNHKFYVVNNGFLLICLQPTIDDSLAKDIINLRDELMTEYCKVILLDKALNSNSSINIYNDLNSENIELDTI